MYRDYIQQRYYFLAKLPLLVATLRVLWKALCLPLANSSYTVVARSIRSYVQ
jgi:hypothetical protein